ncbi:hypothetical protein BsIDN1_15270 [Bacillus safensis]|uniref:SDR-like Ig domain-containing protein n=1 Tax=Bacillus safensis TaxID=561879 RepID=A0A5S9M7J9_BACIA|nr:hypothetical protein BsIDN1_15270 [Bacillus safensis]
MKFNQATIGYFSVDESGNASIEFTDFIKQYSNIHGTLQVWTQLDKKTVITEKKKWSLPRLKERIKYPSRLNTFQMARMSKKRENQIELTMLKPFNGQ